MSFQIHNGNLPFGFSFENGFLLFFLLNEYLMPQIIIQHPSPLGRE